jgi:hypothetical protein
VVCIVFNAVRKEQQCSERLARRAGAVDCAAAADTGPSWGVGTRHQSPPLHLLLCPADATLADATVAVVTVADASACSCWRHQTWPQFSYRCICEEGFMGDGATCVPKGAPAPARLRCGHACRTSLRFI